MHFPRADKSSKRRKKIGETERGSRRSDSMLYKTMASKTEIYSYDFVSTFVERDFLLKDS